MWVWLSHESIVNIWAAAFSSISPRVYASHSPSSAFKIFVESREKQLTMISWGLWIATLKCASLRLHLVVMVITPLKNLVLQIEQQPVCSCKDSKDWGTNRIEQAFGVLLVALLINTMQRKAWCWKDKAQKTDRSNSLSPLPFLSYWTWPEHAWAHMHTR